jgi:hypothetical protein
MVREDASGFDYFLSKKCGRGLNEWLGVAEQDLNFPVFCGNGGTTMQIGSISAIPAIDAATPASATTQSHGSGSAKAGSAVTAETNATAASGVATSGVSSSVSSNKGASQSQQSSSVLSPLDQALAAVYTTSVAGHDFLGTVQQAAGEYVASAADPPAPPITGIGSSIQAAENNLTVVIDEMV